MAESVLIYYDLDPQELNPHIFNPSSGRPIYEENTDGAYLVREVVEDYVSRRIEAGKPAYLNAIVLAADEYENTDPDASNVKKVCAVCRIPGWDVVPPPQGDGKNGIPTQPGYVYGAEAAPKRKALDFVNFNILFNHTIYFPTTNSGIKLDDLLPGTQGQRNEDPSRVESMKAKIVKVTFSDFANRSRPEIIEVTGETQVMAVKVDTGMMSAGTDVGEELARRLPAQNQPPGPVAKAPPMNPDDPVTPPSLRGISLFPTTGTNVNGPIKIYKASNGAYDDPEPQQSAGGTNPAPIVGLPGLQFEMRTGTPFSSGLKRRGRYNLPIGKIIFHWPGSGSRYNRIWRFLEGKYGINKGISVHFIVDYDGSVIAYNNPDNFIAYHGSSAKSAEKYEPSARAAGILTGQETFERAMNSKSVGIEVLGRGDMKPDNNETRKKWTIRGSSKTVEIGPLIQCEGAYRLMVYLCTEYGIPARSLQVEDEYFLWTVTRSGLTNNAKGVGSHGSYHNGKRDHFPVSLYCELRTRGYSEEQSYKFTREAVQAWCDTPKSSRNRPWPGAPKGQQCGGYRYKLPPRITGDGPST